MKLSDFLASRYLNCRPYRSSMVSLIRLRVGFGSCLLASVSTLSSVRLWRLCRTLCSGAVASILSLVRPRCWFWTLFAGGCVLSYRWFALSNGFGGYVRRRFRPSYRWFLLFVTLKRIFSAKRRALQSPSRFFATKARFSGPVMFPKRLFLNIQPRKNQKIFCYRN